MGRKNQHRSGGLCKTAFHSRDYFLLCDRNTCPTTWPPDLCYGALLLVEFFSHVPSCNFLRAHKEISGL